MSEVPADDTMVGVVSSIFPERSFGYIISRDGKEYWFHSSYARDYWNELVPGDSVTFQGVTGPKGPKALKIVKIDPVK